MSDSALLKAQLSTMVRRSTATFRKANTGETSPAVLPSSPDRELPAQLLTARTRGSRTAPPVTHPLPRSFARCVFVDTVFLFSPRRSSAHFSGKGFFCQGCWQAHRRLTSISRDLLCRPGIQVLFTRPTLTTEKGTDPA